MESCRASETLQLMAPTAVQYWPLYSASMCTIEVNTGTTAATGTTPTVVQYWSLHSASMCTIEVNTGTTAATGSTPHTTTTAGCSHLCQAISQALQTEIGTIWRGHYRFVETSLAGHACLPGDVSFRCGS